MADWSQLPNELLQQISQKLNYSDLYLLRFRSVCSSWRRSIFLPNCHHNHLPSKLPHFPDEIEYIRNLPKQQNVSVTIMEPHPSWRKSCGPYCNHNHSPVEIPQFRDPYDRRLFKQNIFLIKPPATLTPHHHHLRPWLIRIGPDVYGKPQIWHPFDVHLKYPLFFAPCHFVHHLIDFNKLPVIDIGHMFYIYGPIFHIGKVVVATCEMGQPLALLTYDRSDVPKILREENSWMNIPTMPRSLWGDICLFKGRPCVADKDGRTLMIAQEDSSVILLANPVFGGYVKFLVESECELLLVDCHGIDIGADDKDMKFDVFRLDEKEKTWIKLTTLGDRVLFLDRECSFSASASDLHVANGNCIIYSMHAKFRSINAIHSGMRIFHLDQGLVSRLSDNPDYIKLFWPPPKWILGMHNQNEFDVSEVIESDNEGSYNDGADIGSGVDDDDDEGSNDDGLDFGSDDDADDDEGSSDDGLDFGSDDDDDDDDDDDGGGGGNEEINEDEKR